VVLGVLVLIGVIVLIARSGRRRPKAADVWQARAVDAYATGSALLDAMRMAEAPGALIAPDAAARWADIQRRADDLGQALYALREAAPDEDKRLRGGPPGTPRGRREPALLPPPGHQRRGCPHRWCFPPATTAAGACRFPAGAGSAGSRPRRKRGFSRAASPWRRRTRCRSRRLARAVR
jgi:hypothetical protein